MQTNLELFLYIFRLIGFTKSTSKDTWFWIVNSIAISLICILLTVCYLERHTIYHVGSFIGLLLDVIQVVLPIIVHLTIHIEILLKNKIDLKMRILMEKIMKTTTKFSVLNNPHPNFNRNNDFMRIWYISISFIVFTTIPELWVIGSGWRPFFGWIESISLRFWSNQVQRLYIIYYLTLMVFIQNTMHSCKHELKYGALDFENRIKLVKKCLNQHFQLEEQIQLRFSWSFNLFLINNVISLTVSMYFIITRIYYAGPGLYGIEGIYLRNA